MSRRLRLEGDLVTRTTEDFKDTALHFCSSELTAHASSIIGLSIMLFAFLEAVAQFSNLAKPPFNLQLYWWIWAEAKYVVVFLILWVITSGIVFQIFRLIYYGTYADRLIHYEEEADSLHDLFNKVHAKVRESKFLRIFPIRWFSSGLSEFPTGLWFSLTIGFVLGLILMWTFFF